MITNTEVMKNSTKLNLVQSMVLCLSNHSFMGPKAYAHSTHIAFPQSRAQYSLNGQMSEHNENCQIAENITFEYK